MKGERRKVRRPRMLVAGCSLQGIRNQASTDDFLMPTANCKLMTTHFTGDQKF